MILSSSKSTYKLSLHLLCIEFREIYLTGNLKKEAQKLFV